MLSPLQQKLLEMLTWFCNYLDKHQVRYYAIGGTLLGAVRHEGFIPWDDDIDIGIPRDDYMKLIKIFSEPVDGYFLESPYSGNADYLYSYAKLYDTQTTLVEHTKTLCKRGIYIDVFPIDGIGNSMEEAQNNFKMFDKKNMFLMMRTCVVRKERSWYKNASILIARCIPPFLINDKKLSLEVDKIAQSINQEDSKYVANLMGTYRLKEITKREYFGTPISYKFENIEIYGPEKYDEYLTNIYKNWRQLPPEDKRKTAHDFITIDLNKSYI